MEPAMGAKEYCRFLAVCTACVGCAAFVSMLFVYYGRRDEKLLYEPFCGFYGVVASLLVAVRHSAPRRIVSLSRARDAGSSRWTGLGDLARRPTGGRWLLRRVPLPGADDDRL